MLLLASLIVGGVNFNMLGGQPASGHAMLGTPPVSHVMLPEVRIIVPREKIVTAPPPVKAFPVLAVPVTEPLHDLVYPTPAPTPAPAPQPAPPVAPEPEPAPAPRAVATAVTSACTTTARGVRTCPGTTTTTYVTRPRFRLFNRKGK